METRCPAREHIIDGVARAKGTRAIGKAHTVFAGLAVHDGDVTHLNSPSLPSSSFRRSRAHPAAPHARSRRPVCAILAPAALVAAAGRRSAPAVVHAPISGRMR